MSKSAPVRYDVAIIGLGPVGCLGALLFAEAGLQVVAFEKEPNVYTLPRAVNLDGEIIRALQPLGLADIVNAMMQPIRQDERAGFANSKREWLFGGYSTAVGSNGWQPANMFDQPELESFLREQVEQHPNVTTHIGFAVTDFSNQTEHVVVYARSSSKDVSAAAHYMVACDGANSSTRKVLGIGWCDLGYDQDWLVVDVTMHGAHDLANEVLQICDPDRIHTYVATKDPYRRWEFQLNPGETPEHMLQDETIQSLLDGWVSRDGYTLRRAAVYQFHAAVAETWQAGRVFLAGDAAHQTPPFLGQGMNSGMRDVINLAWKLPLVLNGRCLPNLLETYQAERDAHAHDLVSWAVDMGHLMEHLADIEAAARAGQPVPEPKNSTQASGYGQGREQPPIRSGAVIYEQISNEGLTGYLMPQPAVRNAQGQELRFDDLLGPNFALLTNGQVELSQESLVMMSALHVKSIDVRTLTLVNGTFPDQLQNNEAILLRPDRLVFGHTDSRTTVDTLISRLALALSVKENL